MKNKKTVTLSVLAVLLVIVVAVTAYMIKKYAPNKTHMDLTKYFAGSAEEGKLPVILEDTLCETTAIEQDGSIYVNITFVKEKLNKRFYWDGNENLLLYTTATQEISAPLNGKDCYINTSKDTKDYVIATAQGGDVYVALDYVQLYTAMDYQKYNKPSRVVIHNVYGEDIDYAEVKDDTQIRYKKTVKSEILQDVKSGDTVRVLEEKDKETGFTKVMSESGVTGYVQGKRLGVTYQEKSETEFQEEVYTHILMDKQVCLGWHQVTNQTANNYLSSVLSSTKGVNVVSPTWFMTIDNEGGISSLASDSYVETAHKAGVQVWALCSDFGDKMKIGTVLGSTSKRQRLEKNLIAEAIRYSLDGINIDFEYVKRESGEDFVQFIRELGIMCRNIGLVLSIDNYPPVGNLSDYYDRAEQAAVADYIITMSYDEHYSGGEEAGPVSSISYVTNSIAEVQKEVPPEQMIIGLPFYSGLWKVKKGSKAKLKRTDLTMKGAKEVVKESGKDAEWDDVTGTNYVEYTKDGVVHKLWMEDAHSLEVKMMALSDIPDADLGGVAFWKLGLEESSVWNMIEKYVKK
ncbi:MAG: glycosyl hydrolase family 18 [Lachnospiraceae bacterium]|nr:glycosyl hydrolase family 18 [Lachnospiraceae bacterium]